MKNRKSSRRARRTAWAVLVALRAARIDRTENSQSQFTTTIQFTRRKQ